MADKGEIVELESMEVYDEPRTEGVMSYSILTHTRDPQEVKAKTLAALAVIEEGKVPPEAIKEREGAGGKMIPYASHVWVTRTMNAAFRWLWDYRCVSYDVHNDGSVSSLCELKVYIPIGMQEDGSPIFHVRTMQEIGSFQAYPRMHEVTKTIDGKKRRVREPLVNSVTGEIEYTMNTADRVASSVSRGLVKAVGRMFDIGFELVEEDKDLSPVDTWNVLLRFGKNQGLTREEIIEIVKDAGLTKENIVDKFHLGYSAIYNAARGEEKEDIPDLGGE